MHVVKATVVFAIVGQKKAWLDSEVTPAYSGLFLNKLILRMQGKNVLGKDNQEYFET